MLFILHTTFLVFGVFTFNKHTLYSVVLHCIKICCRYCIHQFLYLGFSLFINISCTVLYCTVLKYVGYTTYTNSYIWGFTLNKHTLYSTVLYRTKLCWIYTTILILGGFTLNKHTLYSTVLYCTVLYRTKLCWLYTTILILGGFTLNKHTLYSTVLY